MDQYLLELFIPPHNVCDAGDYRSETAEYHVENDLGMAPTIGNSALYLKIQDNRLEGIMGILVDNSLNAGNNSFEGTSAISFVMFEAKPRV